MSPEILGVLMGSACGAVIGIERQWSGHATGPNSHFAGVRTQTLLGGLAAVSGWLWMEQMQAIAVPILIAALAIVVVAYAAVSRRDADATTEVAALVVITAGWFSGRGMWGFASGITVVTAVLLMEKSRLHSWVARIPGVGLRAGLRFALMAVVVLPLLPEGPYGPLGGVRPRELWMLVLLFSGISFIAYVVSSLLGSSRGYLWAGALGGLVSSTNVTLTFSRLSRTTDAGVPLALGVIAACTMLNARILVAAGFLNWKLAADLVPFVALPAAAGVLILTGALRVLKPSVSAPPETRQPLQFWPSIQMAVLFQGVLFLTSFVQERWGGTGLIASGALLGLTDMDALVASMARTNDRSASMAIAAGLIANTALKLGLAVVVGSAEFRKLAAGGLILLAAVTAVSAVLFLQA